MILRDSFPTIESYIDAVEKRKISRPKRCVSCGFERVWFVGNYTRWVNLQRDDDTRDRRKIPIRRCRCKDCKKSFGLLPRFLYPHRQYGPESTEKAVKTLSSGKNVRLSDLSGAAENAPSIRTIQRWIEWLSGEAFDDPVLPLKQGALPIDYTTRAANTLDRIRAWNDSVPFGDRPLEDKLDPIPLRTFLRSRWRDVGGRILYLTKPPSAPIRFYPPDVEVVFCAEQFENDGSTASTIVKSVKRAMAKEYSRELSAKVFTGQCNLIRKGFRQGGMAGFGLRRMLIDEHGTEKGNLKIGDRKSLQTDRVILVPGPKEEVETVRWMFKAFNEEGRREGEIAEILNDRGIQTDLGRPWNRGTVHQVLTNEKYIGHNVYNRVSFKLKQNRMKNAEDDWIRKRDAFEAIVSASDFGIAKGIIQERNRRFSDDQMIVKLKDLFQQSGYISGIVIDESPGMPSSSAYRGRFGSLIRAYKLVGYTPERDFEYIEINRRLRTLHATIVEQVLTDLELLGAHVGIEGRTPLFTINEEFTASIAIGRCTSTDQGSLRWRIRIDRSLSPDITIAVRMDRENEAAIDYYLLPLIDLEEKAERIRLREDNGLALDVYRFDTLDYFLGMAKHVRWEVPL